MPTEIYSTMSFRLREWQINDLASLVKYANNYNVAKTMSGQFPYPYTDVAGAAFIEFARTVNQNKIFAIEVDGKAVGSVGIHHHKNALIKRNELGYWLGEPFWGRGIMTKVVCEVVAFAFKTYEIDRIFARTFVSNIASQRILLKNNFKQEAFFEKVIVKNGKKIDELSYELAREDWLT